MHQDGLLQILRRLVFKTLVLHIKRLSRSWHRGVSPARLPDPYGPLLMRQQYYENGYFKSNLITVGRLLNHQISRIYFLLSKIFMASALHWQQPSFSPFVLLTIGASLMAAP